MSTRRRFLSQLGAASVLLRSAANAATNAVRRLPLFQTAARTSSGAVADCEYLVVGSGAGGGTVAARLAELGHKVMLLEAGGDPMTSSGGNALYPGNTLPEDYEVPAFHANSSENDALKWDFFVRHYADTTQQKNDPKYYETYGSERVDGVLYPRAGTLGGCTAHNAQILVYPHNQDWQEIADATCDPSWSPDKMRKYFERIENCHHRPLERFLHFLTRLNPTRHGFGGWLSTEKALPLGAALGDKELSAAVLKGLIDDLKAQGDIVKELSEDIESGLDPNDWRLVEANATGVRYAPLTTHGHSRFGTRDRLRDVEKRHRLTIVTDALATRVIFDDQRRAVGVEYRKGAKLYRPYGQPGAQGQSMIARASREVILCGGAFNTPQLLMLSGIGPKQQLDKFGITPVKILEGVGKNLQDRYEIGVVSQFDRNFKALDGAEFGKDDPVYKAWAANRSGIYSSNGVALAVIAKSSKDLTLPDLFCFALTGNFHGYYPGYSRLFKEQHDRLTWAVLKAHTLNHGGEVTLNSADPLVAPKVDFHYFEEGTDKAGVDLDAVVQGIKFVRRLTKGVSYIKQEEYPGASVQSDDDIKKYVRDNAWGHHASCTCKIGPESDNGVLDSAFRVHGVTGLRVVDASIFPKIPGFFIVSSIYIAAEKAADVIHRNLQGGRC